MAMICIFVIGVGLLFYVLRCRRQLYYGLFELVVAMVIIIVTFYPQTHYLLLQEFSWQGWFLSKGVGALAGIYVMVRGLDNIEKGLPPKWRAKWISTFSGSHAVARYLVV